MDDPPWSFLVYLIFCMWLLIFIVPPFLIIYFILHGGTADETKNSKLIEMWNRQYAKFKEISLNNSVQNDDGSFHNEVKALLQKTGEFTGLDTVQNLEFIRANLPNEVKAYDFIIYIFTK